MRIEYKQIAQIAAKHDVGFARCRFTTDHAADVPAVRLTGMLSNIQAAVQEIKAISADGRYYTEQADGLYLYV